MGRYDTLLHLPYISGITLGTRQMTDPGTGHITTRAESPVMVARRSFGPRPACASVENRT